MYDNLMVLNETDIKRQEKVKEKVRPVIIAHSLWSVKYTLTSKKFARNIIFFMTSVVTTEQHAYSTPAPHSYLATRIYLIEIHQPYEDDLNSTLEKHPAFM